MNAIKGKTKKELKAMNNEELSKYFAEICMAGKHHVYDYDLVCLNIQNEQANRMPILFNIEKVTLCTGHRVYHATHNKYLEYGEGKTKKEAINDLKKRINK